MKATTVNSMLASASGLAILTGSLGGPACVAGYLLGLYIGYKASR